MTKLVLDLDTGIDDAMALAFACAWKEIELLGVTATYGNIDVERAAQNTLDLLALFGRKDIPVFRGAVQSSDPDWTAPHPAASNKHGSNGIGNVVLPASGRELESQDAVDFILEACDLYQKDLTLVATGPLTNLAACMDQDFERFKQVGKIVVMGGALTVTGSVTPFSETNMSHDPRAADRVFQSGLPVTLVGLDVTLRTEWTLDDTQKWRETGTLAGKKLAEIVDSYIKAYQQDDPERKGCALHDPLAVAVAVQPDLVNTLSLPMMVEVEGPGRGRTIADRFKLHGDHPQIDVAVEVQVEEFTRLFSETNLSFLRNCL